MYRPSPVDSQPHTQKGSTVLARTTVAHGTPSPPTTPQVGLKTSSASSLERTSKISRLIQRKIICALSKSKHVGKLFARRMYLAAIAKGFDGCICALDGFMAAQWKLLIMNDNIYVSLTPFVQKSKAFFKEEPDFECLTLAAPHVTLLRTHFFATTW